MPERADGVDRSSTPALGVEILEEVGRAGQAGPYREPDRIAQLIVEVSRRSATTAIQTMLEQQHSNHRKPDTAAWVRWALGILLALLTALWGASWLFAARPTEDKVHNMIREAVKQHPDSKAGIKANAEALTKQQIQLNRIEDGVTSVSKSVEELKRDFKRGR